MPDRKHAPEIVDAVNFKLQLKQVEKFVLKNGVEVYAADAGAEEALMIQESEAQLWARVDALGEPGRSLLILTYRDGLNSQEIADVLGYSSPEVVRQLRKRCLDKLRKQ